MVINSIRGRMTAAFVAALALLFLLASVSILWYSRQAALRDTAAVLGLAAHRVKQEIQEDQNGESDDDPRGGGRLAARQPPSGKSAEISSARSLLARLTHETHEERQAGGLGILIVNSKGQIIARSDGAAPPWPPGDDWQITTLSSGSRTVVLGMPLDRNRSAIQAEALDLLAIGLIVLCASAVGSWLLVGRTLSPIQHLSRQAAAASADQLRVRLLARSGDLEIVELVHTLNALLSRIAGTAEAKGRFYAAASHELRTPLQALSGHLGLALGRLRTNEEYRLALQIANQQTERLTSLVHSLLFLNQLEVGSASPPTEPVDVAEFCESALAHFRALILERHLRVQTDLPEDAEAMAPPTHVAMLVRNVIENALKYSPEEGEIRIQIAKNLAGVTLTVNNNCGIVPGWDKERIFEPFYRPDASRNSQTGGNGLGLAICKALCLRNQWEIEVTQEQAGVKVIVLFPAPSARQLAA